MAHVYVPEGSVEDWQELPGYDGKYLVSCYGRIRSLYKQNKPCDTLMTPKITKAGYVYYILYKRGVKPASKSWGAGRLVAMMFVPNPDDLPEIGYQDGNKQNLHYTNLFWTEHNFNVRKSQGYFYSYWHINKPDEIFFARSRRQVSLAIGTNCVYFFERKDQSVPNRKGWFVKMHKLSTTDRFKGFDF